MVVPTPPGDYEADKRQSVPKRQAHGPELCEQEGGIPCEAFTSQKTSSFTFKHKLEGRLRMICLDCQNYLSLWPLHTSAASVLYFKRFRFCHLGQTLECLSRLSPGFKKEQELAAKCHGCAASLNITLGRALPSLHGGAVAASAPLYLPGGQAPRLVAGLTVY